MVVRCRNEGGTRPCHRRKRTPNGFACRVPSGFRLQNPKPSLLFRLDPSFWTSELHVESAILISVGVGYLIPSGEPSGASCQSWLAGSQHSKQTSGNTLFGPSFACHGSQHGYRHRLELVSRTPACRARRGTRIASTWRHRSRKRRTRIAAP